MVPTETTPPPDKSMPGLGLAAVSRSLRRQSLLVAGVCLGIDVVGFLASGSMAVLSLAAGAALALVVLADMGLALPTRWSGWVAVGHALVLVLGAAWLGGTPMAGSVDDAGFLIAGYRAGAWLRGSRGWLALAALAGGTATATILLGGEGSDGVVVQIIKDCVLPWLVGRYTTKRRAYIDELERLAETRRRDEREAVDRALTAERSAIARDLHDVVSHHVSAIAVHAGAARIGLTARMVPEAITSSLAAVETSSRDALRDLRHMLDLLHSSRLDTSRQPGLHDLDELLEGVRRAGPNVELSTSSPPLAPSSAVDIALYRAAQEMLTNALRHGDGDIITVVLSHGDDQVRLVVANPLPRKPALAHHDSRCGGLGLLGLRHRAELLHGTLEHGVVQHDTNTRYWEAAITLPMAPEDVS